MKIFIMLFVIIILVALAISTTQRETMDEKEITTNAKEAIFAGGCFWCNEAAFEAVEGVVEVISGYTGGEKENPTYEEVSSGTTGHKEAVKIIYDPEIVTYAELVELYWRQVDPTDDSGQFVDKGSQYLTAIYYQTEEERLIAEESKTNLENSRKFDKPIVTEILPAKTFYEAEEYHQDYYKKRVLQYKVYASGSGREEFKEKNWNEK